MFDAAEYSLFEIMVSEDSEAANAAPVVLLQSTTYDTGRNGGRPSTNVEDGEGRVALNLLGRNSIRAALAMECHDFW